MHGHDAAAQAGQGRRVKRLIIAMLALNLVIGAYVFWPAAGPDPMPAAAIAAATSTPAAEKVHEVVMYGATWCGYCAQTRQYFAANGIRYTEHDIENSDEGRRGFAASGARGIPLVLIDGTQVQGFNPQHMDHLLGR